MDLQPETLLNSRYRIQAKLGQGGMGAVYLARDVSLDHEVAVKANLHPAPEFTNQFLREARLLASLRHPNLPRVTDYFILEDVQYLVMDYIPGQDLDHLLETNGPLPFEQVQAWARQLGSALSYMHRQNPPVIHRDIKPGNIRLSAEGEAILVDFGIAKALSSDQSTETTSRGYTPGFAPPEQYGGMRTSPQSDQYALAATLYTLLAGRKPSDAIQRALGQAVLTPLSAYAPGVPAAFRAALERGLAIKPEERFASMDEFLAALNEPPAEPTVIPSSSPSIPTVIANWADRLPGLRPESPASSGGRGWLIWAIIGAAGMAGLALIGVVAVVLLGARKTPAAPPPATQPVMILVVTSTYRPPPTATDTPMPPPQRTAVPVPSDTLAVPSETALPPGDTPTPNLQPLGQGGVIAFSSDRGDGQTLQIWTMRVGLNDQGQVLADDLRQVTAGDGDKTQPRWSPDGSALLYVAAGADANGLDIWRVPLDGSEPPVDLTQRKGDDSEPAWSPDGSLIAFTNNGREDGVRQLYLMNADGSGQVRLSFDQEEFGPAWSPDMHSLAFVMNASGSQILNLRGQSDPAVEPLPYYVTPERFDYSTLTGTLGQVAQPAWSPDGNWLAYTRQDSPRERIFIARYPLRNPDLDVVRLTDGPQDSAPAWSPDSQWLAFTSLRDGNPEIYVMRANGQGQVVAGAAPGRDLDPAWKPLP